jgi:hypothetical protein
MIIEHKPAPDKNTAPSGEPRKGPFSSRTHSLLSPLPVTYLKAPYWSASHSHILSLWLASFPQVLPFLVLYKPTQPPIQCVPEVLSQGGNMQLGCDAYHSPPSSAEVKNE